MSCENVKEIVNFHESKMMEIDGFTFINLIKFHEIKICVKYAQNEVSAHLATSQELTAVRILVTSWIRFEGFETIFA